MHKPCSYLLTQTLIKKKRKEIDVANATAILAAIVILQWLFPLMLYVIVQSTHNGYDYDDKKLPENDI